MLKKISNQNGSATIILIILILIIGIATIYLINNFKSQPSEDETPSSYTNDDINKWLINIEQISNISFTRAHATGTSTVYTKQYIYDGTIKKTIYLDSNKSPKTHVNISIENLNNNTIILYNDDSKAGKKQPLSYTQPKFTYVNFTYSFDELKKNNYTITETTFNNLKCIKAKNKENVIYFDNDSKLIVKIEDSNDSSNYMVYEDIVLNSVKEQDVSVPAKYSITDKT